MGNIAAVFVATILALVAIGPSAHAQSTKSTTAAEPALPLTVSVGAGCICYVGTYVAEEQGIFRKHGVEVKHSTMSGVQAVGALGENRLQVGGAAPHVIAAARAKGTRLIALFNEFGEPTGKLPADDILAVVARPDSGIRAGHIEDLKGKKIGLNRGTITQMYLFYALAAKHIDALEAVTIQPTPPAELANALESGAIDAIVIYEALASQILRNLKGAVLVQRGGNHIEFLDMALVTPQFLAENPDQLRRYIAAYAEAAQYARLHPDEATDIFMKYVPSMDRTTVRMTIGFLNLDPRISRATEERAKQSFEFAMKIGAVKEVPKFQEIIDLRLFNQVAKEHPEYFRDLPPIPENLKF